MTTNNAKSGKRDYTAEAVKKLFNALDCDRYEIGVFDRELAKEEGSHPMLIRDWDSQMILKSLGWLKAENFNGKDIFIRPQGSVGLIFFDDLNKSQLQKLSADGLEPAVIIESSPLNYQGWLRISDTPISAELATAACKIIAKNYGGDIDSADWRHFGRLPGFTNRKPQYVDERGLYPFVKLIEHRGAMVENATQHLQEASDYLIALEEEREAKRERLLRSDGLPAPADPDSYYLNALQELRERYGESLDLSQADWAILSRMANRGFKPEQLIQVLSENSPAAAKRGSHSLKYIEVTVNNVFGKR